LREPWQSIVNPISEDFKVFQDHRRPPPVTTEADCDHAAVTSAPEHGRGNEALRVVGHPQHSISFDKPVPWQIPAVTSRADEQPLDSVLCDRRAMYSQLHQSRHLRSIQVVAKDFKESRMHRVG
jgi:hypothetical protein